MHIHTIVIVRSRVLSRRFRDSLTLSPDKYYMDYDDSLGPATSVAEISML